MQRYRIIDFYRNRPKNIETKEDFDDDDIHVSSNANGTNEWDVDDENFDF